MDVEDEVEVEFESESDDTFIEKINMMIMIVNKGSSNKLHDAFCYLPFVVLLLLLLVVAWAVQN